MGDIVKSLYVCSKPIADSNGELKQHLLGILSQDDKGEYQFEYKLGNTPDTDRFLLSIFPVKNKTYHYNEARLLLDDYLPSENDTTFIKTILDKAGMTEYNEWEWLKTFESDDDAETCLYETLPDDIICHENINRKSEENNIENSSEMNENDTNPNIDDDIFDDNVDISEIIDINDDIFGNIDDFEDDYDDNSDTDDIFDADIYSLSDNEIAELYDDLDILFDDDFDNTQKTETNNNIEINSIEPTVTVIKKTITTKVKKSSDPNDFIAPSPPDPSEIIKQRLEENIKQRQTKLKKSLSANTR